MPAITPREKNDLEKIERIKENVRNSMDYFNDNRDRFNSFRRFVFESNWTSDEKDMLTGIGKPNLEFNISEAFLSRFLGEFSKQEPSISVSASDHYEADPSMIDMVECHTRYFLCDAKDHGNVQYENMKSLTSGGYSIFKLVTDYCNDFSFDQDIYLQNANPTLCGFDPSAKLSHKGDGRFCFELRPMTEEEFREEFPDQPIGTVKYARGFAGFNWSYSVGTEKILMVCDYYEKKFKKITILKLSDGQVISEKDYQELVDGWDDISQPPVVVSKRDTQKEVIWRYRLYEGGVIEKKKTDFPGFPLIFVDGNSVVLSDSNSGNVQQFTRPYLYHTKGAQKLKNYAGCSLANEVENIIQHKIMVAKEALPKEDMFQDAYKDVQKANVLVFNSFFEQDPDKPIPNPIREVQRSPAPPEIMNAFTSADSIIQMTLGSFDAALGINDNNLSGAAILQGASQSNAASMPYIVGYLAGLQRVADLYIKLIPKYFKTDQPRNLPLRSLKGQNSFVQINSPNGPNLDYSDNDLHVKVEAGVNFRVQKDRALMQITKFMQISPKFNSFMEDHLDILLDNMEFRGMDALKQEFDQWNQQQQMKQAQMAQQQMMMNPAIMKNQIETQKLQQESQKSQMQFQIDLADLKHEQNRLIADIEQSQSEQQVQMIKAQTERFAKSVDLEIQHKKHNMAHKDQVHRHAIDTLNMHHLGKNSDNKTGDINERTETNME